MKPHEKLMSFDSLRSAPVKETHRLGPPFKDEDLQGVAGDVNDLRKSCVSSPSNRAARILRQDRRISPMPILRRRTPCPKAFYHRPHSLWRRPCLRDGSASCRNQSMSSWTTIMQSGGTFNFPASLAMGRRRGSCMCQALQGPGHPSTRSCSLSLFFRTGI
jgi:hypothetical protein